MKLIAGKVAWNYDNVNKKLTIHTTNKENEKKKRPKKLNKEAKFAVVSTCNENSNLNEKNLNK